MSGKKTNAVRLLEGRGASFRTSSYGSADGRIDAVSVARKLGIDPDTVFKTLVTQADDGEILVFCVPGSAELDLKKAAGAAGKRKVELVRSDRLFELTGYVRGGCSPIGMKKRYPVWVDELALVCDEIYISAGAVGSQIVIRPADFLALTGAVPADLV